VPVSLRPWVLFSARCRFARAITAPSVPNGSPFRFFFALVSVASFLDGQKPLPQTFQQQEGSHGSRGACPRRFRRRRLRRNNPAGRRRFVHRQRCAIRGSSAAAAPTLLRRCCRQKQRVRLPRALLPSSRPESAMATSRTTSPARPQQDADPQPGNQSEQPRKASSPQGKKRRQELPDVRSLVPPCSGLRNGRATNAPRPKCRSDLWCSHH
jgi:hypothetical protein